MHCEHVELEQFVERFEADVEPSAMPRNLCLIGWTDGGWVVSGPGRAFPHDRLERLLRFWDRRLRPLLPALPFWTVCCLWDGWRERIQFSEQYRVVPAP